MKLINLTPHEISLLTDAGSVAIPPSGTVARCATSRVKIGEAEIDGVKIPINRTEFGEITGLPEPQDDVLYIVSAIVAQAAKRDDVVIVDDAVRDEQGRIVGARALARV